MEEISIFHMFRIFLRTGTFTIGGGYAMLPILEHEFVSKQKWLTEEEIVDVFALAQTVPGAIAVNTSILIGYRLKKTWGAILAVLGIILPSFIIITIISLFYDNFKDFPLVQKAFNGIRAGVTALIFLAALRIGKKTMIDIFSSLLAVVVFVSVVVFSLPVYLIIPISAVLGFLYHIIREGAAK